MDFGRKCPSCGRRFTIAHGTKTLVDRETGTEKIMHNIMATTGGYGRAAPVFVSMTEDVPIEVDTFTIQYECRNCHHRWTETFTKPEKR